MFWRLRAGSVKGFSDELRRAYHTATVENVPVSCIVTSLPDEDADMCLDCINSIVVTAAVNSAAQSVALSIPVMRLHIGLVRKSN